MLKRQSDSPSRDQCLRTLSDLANSLESQYRQSTYVCPGSATELLPFCRSDITQQSFSVVLLENFIVIQINFLFSVAFDALV